MGVSGGIAAYKAAELVRLLVKEGASVHVVMTANAQQFVTPLTFQALSNNAVGTDLFSMESESRISHIRKGEASGPRYCCPGHGQSHGENGRRDCRRLPDDHTACHNRSGAGLSGDEREDVGASGHTTEPEDSGRTGVPNSAAWCGFCLPARRKGPAVWRRLQTFWRRPSGC